MTSESEIPRPTRLGRLRFAAVSSLFYDPPKHGELKQRLQALSQISWKDPDTGEYTTFGASTLERWFYKAKDKPDPVAALISTKRPEAGSHPSICVPLKDIITVLWQQHPGWSYQLLYDNTCVLAAEGNLCVPSYATVVRFMKHQGMARVRAGKRRFEHEHDLPHRETRSYEVPYCHALWHSDFHLGFRKVSLPSGTWTKAKLLGVLDDHSRAICHAQWYIEENAENFVHGLCQALVKRGLPRSLMSDRGKAMAAAECQEGLLRLGILHTPTLSRSPEQNGKMETFWRQIDGRLLPMLEQCDNISLQQLNQATQAFVEVEYNHKVHSETGQSPLERLTGSHSVGRPAPSLELIRRAFQRRVTRIQRISDGTVSVDGVRFELPSRFRTLREVTLRYAAWDLSHVQLVDNRDDTPLCTLLPLDKEVNADRRRRVIELADHEKPRAAKSGQVAPLLHQLMQDYACTGLPPAYLPKEELPCNEQS